MQIESLLKPELVSMNGAEYFTGYGIVFYDPADPGTETITSELSHKLNATIRIAQGSIVMKGDVECCYQHKYLLGTRSTGTKFAEDAKGWTYRQPVRPGDNTHEIVRSKLQLQEIEGASWHGLVTAGRWHSEGDVDVFTITNATLYEMGPVDRPAMTAATAGVEAANTVQFSRSENDYIRRSWETWKRISKLK